MKNLNTKIVDLYKGFEGETGLFFMAVDENQNVRYYLKCWEGYVYMIFSENAHKFGEYFIGFTRIYNADFSYDEYGFDHLYKATNLEEILIDLRWYKDNFNDLQRKEELAFIDAFIELTELALKNNYDLMIAYDEE